MFDHAKLNHTLEDLTVDSKEYGRIYIDDKGFEYPSVTTVLSVLENKGLEEWRKRVGEEEANRVSKIATVRGEAVHKIFEDYLNNIPSYQKGHMPATVSSFLQLKPILDQRVNNIHYQEAPLYSKYLRCAGRVDCIAEFDGKLSIIDFKTSKREKEKNYISSYFMQTSAYAVMYEERTGIPVSQIVILISVDDGLPQVFIEKRDDHIKNFMRVRKNFFSKYGE